MSQRKTWIYESKKNLNIHKKKDFNKLEKI